MVIVTTYGPPEMNLEVQPLDICDNHKSHSSGCEKLDVMGK